MTKISRIFIVIIFLNISSLIKFVLNTDAKNEDWAVLVAGSYSYDNYRHQADVAHAYQLLLERGYAKDKIITMMYNDVVNDIKNPHKGKLFNKPNGPDVYHGINIDYTEENVTAKNFLAILNGTEKMGKVLKVKPTERVFIFLSDHGADGMFAFPEDILTSLKLVNGLIKLAKRSKGVTIFVESCFSGSLFMDYISEKKQKILAFTAANDEESSYACYWSEEMNAYLGDAFSVNWMETVEAVDTKETNFLELYNVVKKLTNESHVLKFGSQKMLNLSLNEVFGSKSQIKNTNHESLILKYHDRVASHDAQLFTVKRYCQKNMDKECLHKLIYLKKSIKKLEFIFNKLKIEMEVFKTRNNVLTNNSLYSGHVYSCYEDTVMFFSKNCINYNKVEKSFDYLGIFLEMCAIGMDVNRIANLIKTNC